MGKKYLDTKEDSLESSILAVWQEAAKKQEKLDPVGKEDDDVDNDGDVDSSDKYLAKRRKAISKAIKKDEGAMKRGKDLDTFKPKPKKEEVKEYYEMGTDEYRKHTQKVTPGQEIQDYGQLKMQSMKEALAKVWGLDEAKEENKDLTKMVKDGKTLTGKKVDEVDVEPKVEKKK